MSRIVTLRMRVRVRVDKVKGEDEDGSEGESDPLAHPTTTTQGLISVHISVISSILGTR